MPRITPNLWFDDQSLDAAEFYTSIFPNSKVTEVTYYGKDAPRPEGTVLTVNFLLDGQEITAINGGPHVHVQRGDLAPDQLRRPGGDRPLLEQPHRRRRRGEPVRLVEGQVRPLLAGRARPTGRR